jgi:hypothetical protein
MEPPAITIWTSESSLSTAPTSTAVFRLKNLRIAFIVADPDRVNEAISCL